MAITLTHTESENIPTAGLTCAEGPTKITTALGRLTEMMRTRHAN